ncbi:MAG: MATE family efflux transporter [Gemmatimonadota bacterium]|nr:MATE family efflux transporter [Gemmatimonadota bacterium]
MSPTPEVYRSLLRLSAPVVVVQVGMMAMGVVDTLMVGRVSAADLGAVALGNLYWFSTVIFGQGTLFALDPLVSQAVGADDEPGVARSVQRGLLLALVFGAVAVILLALAEPVLRALDQPPDVVPIAAGYCRAAMGGTLPFLGFVVFRQALQAAGVLRPIVVTVLAANVLNAALNWVLVFGHAGAPALGAVGTGWASSASRWVMLIGVVGLAWPQVGPWLRRRPEAFRPAPVLRMVRLGLPVGLHMGAEYGAFAITGLLMGTLGTIAVASHQITLNLAALTFMVPLGVSQATAVLVGRAVGRGDPDGARRAARAGLTVGTGFMVVSAGLFLAVPDLLARAYTDEPGVLALAVRLIPIAGVFQIVDGLQVVAAGTLRGVGDTTVPMFAGLLGFYAVGLPIGFALSRTEGAAGAPGLWWGLAVGLGAVAAFLLLRVWIRFRGALERLEIDEVAPSVG